MSFVGFRLLTRCKPASFPAQVSKRPLNTSRQVYSRVTRKKVLAGVSLGATATGITFFQAEDRFRDAACATERCGTAAYIALSVAADYKFTMSRSFGTKDEAAEAKRQCDLRCAQRVLAGLLKLGGIYVKLGQHISAMMYVLPVEWTSTMAVLQDQCEPTSANDIQQLFLSDCGSTVEGIFEEFDWTPLGVASLAQVHRARLRPSADGTRAGNDGWVAVKLQHPRLDRFCRIDMETVASLVGMIKRMFPEFGFEWILQEMQESLPQEMDFEREAINAQRVAANFAGARTALVIPTVIWAQRRVLCMEFIEGARIDDLAYLKAHHIDPNKVSTELTEVFSKMMFLHGFVHCDPHPGNIMIRPAKKSTGSRFNFDIVLLDHGLYRTLSDRVRLDYAHLWTSLIRGDEDGIQKYALRVGCKANAHRLFASLLTGREWHTIESADLSSLRSKTEVTRVSSRAVHFLIKIADILSTLPRIVILLLKTSDLLRSLDETLRSSPDKCLTYMTMGRYCALAVWLDAKESFFQQIVDSGLTLKLLKHIGSAWWEYCSLTVLYFAKVFALL